MGHIDLKHIFRLYLRLAIVWPLKYGTPILAVLFIAMPIYSWVKPNPEDMKILNNYDHSVYLLHGASHFSHNSQTVTSRTYLLLSFDKMSSKTVTLDYIDNANTNPEIQTESGGFMKAIFAFLLFLLSTWFFWFRKTPTKSVVASENT